MTKNQRKRQRENRRKKRRLRRILLNNVKAVDTPVGKYIKLDPEKNKDFISYAINLTRQELEEMPEGERTEALKTVIKNWRKICK